MPRLLGVFCDLQGNTLCSDWNYNLAASCKIQTDKAESIIWIEPNTFYLLVLSMLLIRHRPFCSPFSCFWTPLPVSMDSPLILWIPAVYDASLKLFKTLSHTAWTGEECWHLMISVCSRITVKRLQEIIKTKQANALWIIAMFKLLRKKCVDYYSLSLPFTSERLFLFASAKEEKLQSVLKRHVTCTFTGSIRSVISFLQEFSRDSRTKKCSAIAIET